MLVSLLLFFFTSMFIFIECVSLLQLFPAFLLFRFMQLDPPTEDFMHEERKEGKELVSRLRLLFFVQAAWDCLFNGDIHVKDSQSSMECNGLSHGMDRKVLHMGKKRWERRDGKDRYREDHASVGRHRIPVMDVVPCSRLDRPIVRAAMDGGVCTELNASFP